MVAGPIIIPITMSTALSFLSVRALVENFSRSVARNHQSPRGQMTPLSSFSSFSEGDTLVLFLLM